MDKKQDQLICVDTKDRPIGTMGKAEAHRNPVLHRAFSVFLFHGNQMFLQRRNPAKYHSGGLLANACCSHPRYGETLEEAVPRRMWEELRVECPVQEAFSFTYMSKYQEDLYEYEFDHVFLGEYAGPVYPNPEEMSEGFWMPIDELERRMVEEPSQFASWFLIAAPRAIAIREERRASIFCWQEDPRWAEIPYWDGTFADHGCGLMSLTMCINGLRGTDYSPLDVYRMRARAGLDQFHMVDKEGRGVCGGDVQIHLNPFNEKLFGVKAMPLERSEETFRTALAEGAWIWASAGEGAEFLMKDGNVRRNDGHILCIWKFDGQHYWVKDPGRPADLCNNVRYSQEQMRAWIDSRTYQQYALVRA